MSSALSNSKSTPPSDNNFLYRPTISSLGPWRRDREIRLFSYQGIIHRIRIFIVPSKTDPTTGKVIKTNKSTEELCLSKIQKINNPVLQNEIDRCIAMVLKYPTTSTQPTILDSSTNCTFRIETRTWNPNVKLVENSVRNCQRINPFSYKVVGSTVLPLWLPEKEVEKRVDLKTDSKKLVDKVQPIYNPIPIEQTEFKLEPAQPQNQAKISLNGNTQKEQTQKQQEDIEVSEENSNSDKENFNPEDSIVVQGNRNENNEMDISTIAPPILNNQSKILEETVNEGPTVSSIDVNQINKEQLQIVSEDSTNESNKDPDAISLDALRNFETNEKNRILVAGEKRSHDDMVDDLAGEEEINSSLDSNSALLRSEKRQKLDSMDSGDNEEKNNNKRGCVIM